MQTASEILEEIFEPSPQDCKTPKEDLQLAITLNPDLDKIIDACHRFKDQFLGWIPVTEKLPKAYEEVVGYDADKGTQHLCAYSSSGKYWFNTEFRETKINITHFHYLLPNPQ